VDEEDTEQSRHYDFVSSHPFQEFLKVDPQYLLSPQTLLLPPPTLLKEKRTSNHKGRPSSTVLKIDVYSRNTQNGIRLG
jgi:hypothetical protein